MGAYKKDKNQMFFIINLNNKPIMVSAYIEYHFPITHKIGRTE